MTDLRCIEDIGVLEANLDCGEGSVRISERFYAHNSTWELDVLGDWIGQLQSLYDDLHNQRYEEGD